MKKSLITLCCMLPAVANAQIPTPNSIHFDYESKVPVFAKVDRTTPSSELLLRSLNRDIAKQISDQYKNATKHSPVKFKFTSKPNNANVVFQIDAEGEATDYRTDIGSLPRAEVNIRYGVTCQVGKNSNSSYNNTLIGISTPKHEYTQVTTTDLKETFNNLQELASNKIARDEHVKQIIDSCH
ncbi:hypothetical protein AB4571_02620 [Vibrio breoganii]